MNSHAVAVLRYGDLVDFGSFDTSVSDDATNEPISFSFVVDQLSPEEARIFLRPYGGRYYRPHLPEYRRRAFYRKHHSDRGSDEDFTYQH